MSSIPSNVKKRLMVHSDYVCGYECKYCFAKRNDYHNSCRYTSIEDAIVYPFCDSEILFQDYTCRLTEIVEHSKKYHERIIISISTKAKLPNEVLDFLNDISNQLACNNGFLKLSVSITNKSCNDLERGTASYEERLDLLDRIKTYQFKSSVVLKPILPFISESEYIDIVKDTSLFVNKYLIGGLYVDPTTSFYFDYIKDKYKLEQREVDWLDEGTKWDYIDSTETQKSIKAYISSIGKSVFDNDRDLIMSWL